MNTEMNSEQMNAISTPPAAVRIVVQSSGQAWSSYCGTPSTTPDLQIAWSCLTKLPPAAECASPTYPIAFGSFFTCVATSPSLVCWMTFDAWVLPPSTACWKNVYRPALEFLPTGTIVVVRFEPGTWLQFVSVARKM